MIWRALELAKAAHKGQTRKYTLTPYILHPIRVAGMVMARDDADEGMVCAGFLHDTLEDTSISTFTIQAMCDAHVLHLVMELTNTSKKELPNASRAVRKSYDRARLANVSQNAKIIKLCDRMDNLREMGGASDEFKRIYVAETKDLLRLIQDADPQFAAQVYLEADRLLQGVEV